MLKTTLLLLIAANQAEAIKLGQCCGGCDNKNDDDHEEDKVDSEDLALKASLPELTEANPELTQALPALAAALPDLAAVLPELDNEFPALATALPVLSATLPNISTESSLPTSNHGLPEPSFIDDLFDMLDGDSNDLIAMHVAKKKCEDWVPEKMDEKTAQLYWSVLSGTKERYGCHSYSENGKCKVSYEDVKKYISDEGYWQAWDGYWYKESEQAPENIPTISDDIMLKSEPIEESILVVDLFAMLDADSNNDIHMNAAEWKVTDWVPSKMTQQTADTYWAILIGTEERYGCIFMNGQDRCVIGFDEVAQYIEDEGYEQSAADGYWYPLTPTPTPVEAPIPAEPATHSDLADALFLMLDGNSSGDINTRIANDKCSNWVPDKMDQQTSDTYRAIVNGTEEIFGCSRYNNSGDCVISYADVLQYITDYNYMQSADDGYWFPDTLVSIQPIKLDASQPAPEPIVENELVVDLFEMLDADSNDDIHMNAAEWKVKDWVPSKMTQQTADTYWEILLGTEERYGCLFVNGQNRCVVGYGEVAQYIEDEGYWQSPDDGYWYKDLPVSTQPVEPIVTAAPVEPVDTIQSNYAFTVDCTGRNYADSIAFCESQLMSIASIHNQEDNDTILGMIQAQCGTGWVGAYIGAESDGAGNWSWNDGSAWDFVSPSNDGIRGVNETKIAFMGNSEWHDWATGQATHGVVCQDMMVSTMPVEPIVTAAPVEPIEVSAPVTNEPNYVYSVDCTKRNYANSVSYCESQGMTMATIHNQEDNDTIQGLLQAQNCRAYTGAYRESAQTSWTWEDGSAWDYENPGAHEMNGWQGHHESRLTVGTNGKWADWGTGSATHGVICQDMIMSTMPVEPVVTTTQPTVESYIYTVDCTQRNYANSVSYCQSKGMTLATVHTQEDNNTIKGLLQAKNCARGYTAAYRESEQTSWTWDDGSAWDFQNPASGELNGWMGWHESRMIIAKNGQWRDWGTGEATHGVICMDTVVSTMPVEPVEVAEPVPYEIKITGTSAYGGAYNDEWHQIEDLNGRPQWERSGANWDTIYWDATRWQLRYSGYNQPAYVCNQDTMLPPKNGWVNARESGGAPTLHY